MYIGGECKVCDRLLYWFCCKAECNSTSPLISLLFLQSVLTASKCLVRLAIYLSLAYQKWARIWSLRFNAGVPGSAWGSKRSLIWWVSRAIYLEAVADDATDASCTPASTPRASILCQDIDPFLCTSCPIGHPCDSDDWYIIIGKISATGGPFVQRSAIQRSYVEFGVGSIIYMLNWGYGAKTLCIAYFLYRWLKRFQGTSTGGRSCLIGQIPAKRFLPRVSSRDIIAGLFSNTIQSINQSVERLPR
jgi:hypothetical protein